MTTWTDLRLHPEQLPPEETEVLIVVNGKRRIAELRWDHPGFEDTYKSYRYWDDPENEGRDWEHHKVTHWAPLQELPWPTHKDKAEDKNEDD